MRKLAVGCVVAAVAIAMGCSENRSDGDHDPDPASPADEASAAPAVLPTPFTAEQIREEWVEGFELRIRRWTPEAEGFEHWKVTKAGDVGVEIEAATVTADGTPLEEPRAQHSTWAELRDHASFPADRSRREEAIRTTALGDFEGWLYTVEDPGSGAVSEFFFAHELAGAPVFVHVIRDGEIVEIFEQVERSRS